MGNINRKFTVFVILYLSQISFCQKTDTTQILEQESENQGLKIQNGWFVQNHKVIWGSAQHNGWWGGYQESTGWIKQYKVRTAICRNAPGKIGPSYTEDLDKLTDAMKKYGYPGFEHNYGLWFDRRRDNHDTQKRIDANVAPPLLEQPWIRSTEGRAWDGLPKYDLTQFNTWYFNRLKRFAELCEQKGTILFHNFHMQHALLENPAHYVDFPWRPVNCIQETGMPDNIPAANAFYDISNPNRRKLHELYINKCLDELGDYSNIIHFVSQEYTGPLSFMEFWIDTIIIWEQKKGKQVKIGLKGTKDVIDAILEDPRRGSKISTICLSYWWYNTDGTLYSPQGGKEIAGRYIGNLSKSVSPESLYRQIREYRQKYPNKAIVQHQKVELEKTWAFLMAGGSMIIGRMQYADSLPPKKPWEPPDDYIAPEESIIIQPTYDFINKYLSEYLPNMKPVNVASNTQKNVWCLANVGQVYLYYSQKGTAIELDLSAIPHNSFKAFWFNPRSGDIISVTENISGNNKYTFTTPDKNSWAMLIYRN